MREEADNAVIQEFSASVGDIISGEVQQGRDENIVYVYLGGRTEGKIPPTEQVKGEVFKHGDRIKAVYSHWDGYLEHHGVILQAFYPDSVTVNKLISMGDVSSLGASVGEKVDFGRRWSDEEYVVCGNTPASPQCIFYGRDRGEVGRLALAVAEAEAPPLPADLPAVDLERRTLGLRDRERLEREVAALAAVRRAGDHEDVLDIDDEDDEPEDERQEAADIDLVHRLPRRLEVGEALLERVQGARSDVAEYDPHRTQGQRRVPRERRR